MIRDFLPGRAPAILLCTVISVAAASAQAPAGTPPARKAPPAKTAAAPAPALDPKAVDLLKAMSAKLASARTFSFTAVSTYESPSMYGAPLAFTTASEVLLQRPDKMRVLTAGDGPAVEYYYDGKTITQYSPAENLVAVAEVPSSIDGMLKALYDRSGTYFTFTDYLVADPYADMAPGLKLAFSIGQSNVVGGTTTDMVAYEDEGVFVQVWIGAQDKLPRMARAVYYDDPLQLRHQVELSNWKIDPPIAGDAFGSAKAATGIRIPFANPKSQAQPAKSPSKMKKPATQAKPTPKAPSGGKP